MMVRNGPENQRRLESSHAPALLLPGTLILGALLRLYGVNFGLPYLYHPDEPGYVSIAQNILKNGDLNPHFFNYPSLFFYINSLAYVPYYLVGHCAGWFTSVADIPAPHVLAMGVGKTMDAKTFLLGRLVTTGFSTATIALVYLAGSRLSGTRAVGAFAGLLTAISPTAVLHSHFITPDTLVAFFIALSTLWSIYIGTRGRLLDYCLAGVFCGLAAATKYNGGLVIVSAIAAHCLRHGWRGWRHPYLALLLLLAAAAFLLTTPFSILDYGEFVSDLRFEAEHYATGHAGMEGDALAWYGRYLWESEGPLMFLTPLVLVLAAHRRHGPTVAVASFPLVYLALIGSLAVRNDRTLLPMLPPLFMLTGVGLAWLFDRVASYQSLRLRRVSVLLVAAVALSLTVPLHRSITNVTTLALADGREAARAWIEENLPSGSRVALESYAPYVDPTRFSVSAVGRVIDQTHEWYSANRIEYVVSSQGMFGRFYRDPTRYSNEIELYEKFFASFQTVREFTDGGYIVKILRVR